MRQIVLASHLKKGPRAHSQLVSTFHFKMKAFALSFSRACDLSSSQAARVQAPFSSISYPLYPHIVVKIQLFNHIEVPKLELQFSLYLPP